MVRSRNPYVSSGAPHALTLIEEAEEQATELVGFLDVRGVAAVAHDLLAVAAAVRGVGVEDGAGLGDHRLRRVGPFTGPVGDDA